MAYVIPQVLVYQEYTQVPQTVVDPLRAHISGGNAQLFRYSDAEEKLLIDIGAYDPLADTDYLWPNRPTGGIVDQSYVKLYAEDVLLKYFEDLVGVDSNIAPVGTSLDRVRSHTVNFKENVTDGGTYARAAVLLDRDVAVGDVIDLTASVTGTTYSLRSTITDIVGDVAAAVVAAATADAANQSSQGADDAIVQTVGPYNCVQGAVNSTAYEGSVDGDIDETYTVTVTRGSTDGDHTSALLRVRSASGNDDEDDVVPADMGTPFAIGSRGVLLTLDANASESCSSDADDEGVSTHDLLAGQTWVISVEQAFDAPVATSGGTYTLEYDTTYIVEVTRGGEFTSTDKPQITVTTIHGVDTSGPTNVPAAGTAVAVGTGGVTVSFGRVGLIDCLRKGDIYYIVVTAEYETNMRTLVFNDNMPAAMLGATDMDLQLYISKSGIEIEKNRTGYAPLTNYELGDPGISDTGFTVNAGIILYDSTWTDSGVTQPLDVAEATLFIEYRAWIPGVAGQIYSIDDVADIDDIPGELDPDNPLKWAVYKALSNSNGTTVKYTAVENPDDVDDWLGVLEVITGASGIYGLVPLTYDQTVLDAYAAHVDAQSSATEGNWRVLWVNLLAVPTVAIVDSTTSSDDEEVLATISDDPDTVGDQFTIVRIPGSNGKFVTNGVRAGDIMRYNYTTDGWDGEAYDEYVIDQVVNEDTLRLETGQGTTEQTVAKKMTVYRTLTNTELATQLATSAATYGDKRVRAVWPDTLGAGNESFAGYHLCAALAGLRSGVAPNQGLTNLEIAGFDDVDRTVNLFNKSQLNTMANAGVFIVTATDDGTIITRHGLTTAGYGDLLTQEESIIANVDSMSYVFLDRVADMIGVYNVTPATLDLIELRLEGTIEYFKEVRVERIGGQLTDGSIIDVRQHTLLKDRVIADLELTVPVPLNNLVVSLQIIA